MVAGKGSPMIIGEWWQGTGARSAVRAPSPYECNDRRGLGGEGHRRVRRQAPGGGESVIVEPEETVVAKGLALMWSVL